MSAVLLVTVQAGVPVMSSYRLYIYINSIQCKPLSLDSD